MAGSSKKVFELFVSRVPWTYICLLMEYFGQFGHVKNCLIPFDKETGFHRGLNNALQKELHMLEGSRVRLESFQKQNSAAVMVHSMCLRNTG
uniref:SRA stem-loop interacting RNA binding protein n=1 Tax=Gouania willdenowi TaxID=441366 RepID=A0A8C5G229_GOUWI